MNPALNVQISDVLKQLGVPMHLKGHFYLKSSIAETLHDPKLMFSICELYSKVADEYDVDPMNVERNIRHAIKVAWSRGDRNAQLALFGHTVDTNKGKPTNSEFICAIVDWFNNKGVRT